MLSYPADMAELADAPDLGSGVERRAGSSPVIRIFYKAWKPYDPVSHCVGIFRKGFCKGTSPVPLHTLGFFGKHEPWYFRFVMCIRRPDSCLPFGQGESGLFSDCWWRKPINKRCVAVLFMGFLLDGLGLLSD